eukprot:m.270456 g.270456  ORF g.270456 m.270456 type:complete len:340 (+) comp16080_c0_seq3:1033-2052(+)
MLRDATGSLRAMDTTPITVAMLAPQNSGKTYATVWLIGELNPLRKWDTLLYLGPEYDSPANALLRQHVRPDQVVTPDRINIAEITDQARARYVTENKRTVIIIDDLADEIFDGKVDIRGLTKRGRHAGIDTFVLLQGNFVANRYGKAIRKNITDVIAFRTCVDDLKDFQIPDRAWPTYQAKITQMRDDGNRVGIALANNTTNVARLGSADKRLSRFKAGEILTFNIPGGFEPAGNDPADSDDHGPDGPDDDDTDDADDDDDQDDGDDDDDGDFMEFNAMQARLAALRMPDAPTGTRSGTRSGARTHGLHEQRRLEWDIVHSVVADCAAARAERNQVNLT